MPLPVLFRPPPSEPCLHLSAHTALQLPIASQVGDAHLTYRPVSLWYHLPPFVMSWALPQAFGYYGGSVAMRFAPCRRSRLCTSTTLVCLGSPFPSLPRSLSGTHRRELSQSQVSIGYFRIKANNALLRCRRFKDAAAGAEFHRWKVGFNQSRFSLYPLRDFLHTGLAALHATSFHI